MAENDEFQPHTKKYRTPDGVPADIVLFTITSEPQQSGSKALPKRELEVLLIKRKWEPFQGKWALPGGFSNENETLFQTAKRELHEETGIDDVHIEHFGIYSTPGRDPRGWIISAAYVALVHEHYLAKRKAADDADDVQLFTLKQVMNDIDLAFDHKQIIMDAYARVQERMRTTTIAREFLPKEFAISELFQVISTVLPDFQEEKSNFIRKVTATKSRQGLIEEVVDENGKPKMSTQYSQRPAQLYRFTDVVPKLSVYH